MDTKTETKTAPAPKLDPALAKMHEFLALYDNMLVSNGVPRIEQKYETPSGERRLSHVRWMIDDLQHGPRKKNEAYRFIQFGLIQGGLWAESVFSPHVLLEHREILLDAGSSPK